MTLYIKNQDTGQWLYGKGTETPDYVPDGCVDLVPALTSNSMNGWIASASYEYNEAGQYAAAHKAFNKVVDGNWINACNMGATYPAWVALQSPMALTVKFLGMQIRTQADTLYPGVWQPQGWDGSNWVPISWLDKYGAPHTTAYTSWFSGELKLFEIETPTAYSKHRIYVTAGGVQCEISEISLYG